MPFNITTNLRCMLRNFANLPSNRWVKRVLAWNPTGARTRGHPRHDWTSKLMAYMRFRQLGQRHSLAQEPGLWMQLSNDFVRSCSTLWCFGLTLLAPQGGLPSDMQAQSQSQSHLTLFCEVLPINRSTSIKHRQAFLHGMTVLITEMIRFNPEVVGNQLEFIYANIVQIWEFLFLREGWKWL